MSWKFSCSNYVFVYCLAFSVCLLVAVSGGCARVPDLSEGAEVHPPQAPRGVRSPLLHERSASAGDAAAVTVEPTKVGTLVAAEGTNPPKSADTSTVTGIGSVTPESVVEAPILSEEVVLRVYREVYCARKTGSETSVKAVWARHGITSENWAQAVQAAAEQAAVDPTGFGERFSAITATPCP